MSDVELTRRLSGEEVAALAFAARRQLTRWAHKERLADRQCAQRTALIGAVRVLGDRALAAGCELRVVDGG